MNLINNFISSISRLLDCYSIKDWQILSIEGQMQTRYKFGAYLTILLCLSGCFFNQAKKNQPKPFYYPSAFINEDSIQQLIPQLEISKKIFQQRENGTFRFKIILVSRQS